MDFNPFTLSGKTILVTGASSGIGRATAIVCARMGARVVLSGRNTEALVETKSMLELSDKQEFHAIISADLALDEGVKRLVEECPVLDGCVSDAGVGKMSPIQFINREDLERVYSINTFSHIMLTKELVKRKKLNKLASIVYVASISGYSNTTVANAIYGTSKSALASYVKYAALELASRGIRCNSVHPGRIETPLIMNDKLTENDIKRDIELYPLKRYGQPEEVAYQIVYLLSNASAWVTGSQFVIDGGRSLN